MRAAAAFRSLTADTTRPANMQPKRPAATRPAMHAGWRAVLLCATLLLLCTTASVAAAAAPGASASHAAAAVSSSPLQQPAFSNSSLPPPLPVFEAGLWDGEQVMIPSSACAHFDSIVMAQDKRPGHELDWWISCDISTALQNLGVWSRQNATFRVVLPNTVLASIDQADADDVAADGASLMVVVQSATANGWTAIYTFDVNRGAESLRKIVESSPDCRIDGAIQHGGEVLYTCGSAGSDVRSIWLADSSAPRVVFSSANGVQQMTREGATITLVANFGEILTYELGVGRETQPQRVFNQSSTLCTNAVLSAYAGPQSVVALCMKVGAPSTIATWTRSSDVVIERTLNRCNPAGSTFDARTGAMIIQCQSSYGVSALWLATSNALTVLTSGKTHYPSAYTFDDVDLHSIVHLGYSQLVDSTWVIDARRISGDGVFSWGSLCEFATRVAVDEVRSLLWIACGSGDSPPTPPFVLRVDGLQQTSVTLPSACRSLQSSLVPAWSQWDYLALCWPPNSQSSFIAGVSGGESRVLVAMEALYDDFVYISDSAAVFAFTSDSLGIDRVDLTTGVVVNVFSSTFSSGTVFGCLGAWVYFWLGGGVLSIPANSTTAVQPREVVPLSGDCSAVIDVQFDEFANTLWVACTERMLVWNLTSGAPSTSARVFAYPSLGRDGFFAAFHLDALSGVIVYEMVHALANSVLVLADNTGAIFRVDSCFGAAFSQLDRRASIFYTFCDSGSFVGFSTAFACPSGTGWANGACQPCAAGSAHTAVPFDPTRRQVAQCMPCASGWVAPESGAAECTPCPVGQFLASTANQACSPCQPGYSQNETGTTFCSACSPGRYSSDIQFANCTLAPPGSFVPLNHSSAVTLCSRGSASNEWGRSTPCDQCPPGFESAQYGGTECTVCPLGSSATSGLCSLCPVATYTPSEGSQCVLCTDADQSGLVCNGFASVKEGWWAYAVFDAQQNVSVYRTTECPFGFCPGAALQQQTAVNSSAPQLCTPPRLSAADNWLCAACEPGYLPWGDQCDQCTAPNVPLIFAVVLVCFLVVCYLLAAGVSSARQISVLLYFVQIAALELPPAADWLAWIKFANLSASSVHSCLAPLSPLQQSALTFSTPLVLCAVLAVTGAAHGSLTRCIVRARSSFTRTRYLNTLLGVFLFSYTAVSLAVMESLHCVEIAPGVRRLYAAPTVDCDSQAYRSFLPLAVIVLCAFIIGLPVAMLAMMWRQRRQASPSSSALSDSDPSDSAAASFSPMALFSLGYIDSAWFWAPLILLRRFLFAVVAVLLTQEPVARNAAFALLHIAFLLLHQWTAPFEAEEINRVERASYVLLFVLSSFLSVFSAPFSTAQQLLLFALVVPAGLALLGWSLKHALRSLRKKVHSLRSEKTPFESYGAVQSSPLPAVDPHSAERSDEHSLNARPLSLSLNDEKGLRRTLLLDD